MPPREVFSINFRKSNMIPVSNVSWGDIVPGGSPTGAKTVQPTSRGLRLFVSRDEREVDPVSNSIYVLPPEEALPFQSRLRLRLWFEQPYAEPWPGTTVPPAPPMENWAVGLKVKFGRELDPPDERFVAVTCQFSRAGAESGVRVNGVKEEQADRAAYLDSPLHYSRYRAGCLGFGRAPEFMLELNFCGMQAGPKSGPPTDPPQLGYAVGSASLSIDSRYDHRPFSNREMSTSSQEWIGALGVSIATIRGVGKYRVTLRKFAIYLW